MIVGGAAIVGASVAGGWYAVARPAWLDAQLATAGPEVAQQIDAVLPRQVLVELIVACAACGAIEGGLSMLLGAFVGRGARWAIATSVAVTLVRLGLVALAAVAVAAGAALGQGVDATTAAVVVAAGIVLVATLAFLFRSRGAVPPALPVARPS